MEPLIKVRESCGTLSVRLEQFKSRADAFRRLCALLSDRAQEHRMFLSQGDGPHKRLAAAMHEAARCEAEISLQEMRTRWAELSALWSEIEAGFAMTPVLELCPE